MSQPSTRALNLYGYLAGSDLSAKINLFMKYGSDHKSVVLCGAGERPVGILQSTPSTSVGSGCEVAVSGGGAKLILAGTVTKGMLLKSDNAGKGVKCTAAGDEYGARAEQDGESGDVIAVEVVTGTAHASE